MNDANLYYTPPPQEDFEDMKKAAIEIWSEYDNQDYKDEKIGAIKEIENVRDNFMYMLAMFDIHNQRKVGDLVSDNTKEALRARLIDGGNPEWAMPF